MKRIKRKRLSDYQEISVAKLVNNDFWCLFDAPGVGKTPPTLVAAWQKVRETGYPALIIAPAYLVNNWVREARVWVPEARLSVVEGGTEDRRDALCADADLIICSYHTMNPRLWTKEEVQFWLERHPNKVRKDMPKCQETKFPELEQRQFSAIAFDEGHRLRTRGSVWTKRVFSWRNASSRHKRTPLWILTGTPMMRDGGNVWPFLYLYDRRRFKSFWAYVNDFCVTKTTPWSTEIYGIRPEKLDDFHAILGEFSLRRTQKDVPELAHLDEMVTEHYVKTPKSVVTAIEKMKKSYRLEHPDLAVTEFFDSSGAMWVRQRQLATNPPTKEKPKLEWVQDFLEDHPERVVVYTWYKETAQKIYDLVSAGKRTAALYTGDQTERQREAALSEFRQTEDTVLVATISALKEGINLTEGRTIVFVEQSTLPSDNEQCIARLKRRGQDACVSVHFVYAEDTVDEAIQAVVSGRAVDIKEAVKEWLGT